MDGKYREKGEGEELGGSLKELAVLVEFAGHAHVAELVADGNHYTTDQGRVNRVGDVCLLSLLEEAVESGLDLLGHGAVQSLGCGQGAHNLTPVGRHDGGERAGNPGDKGESVVLGHGEQKVLAERVQLHLVSNTAETVVEEVGMSGVGLEGAATLVRSFSTAL